MQTNQFLMSILKNDRMKFLDLIVAIKTKSDEPYYAQLVFDQGHGFTEESSLRLPVAKNIRIQEFVFDLSDKQPFYAFRLDPLNDACVIEIENVRLIHENGELDLLPYIHSNAITRQDKRLFFEFHDSQIYFKDYSLYKLSNVKTLVVTIRFAHIGKNAGHACIKQLSAEKNHLQQMINETKSELNIIYSSKSWKITYPLRRISKIFRRTI